MRISPHMAIETSLPIVESLGGKRCRVYWDSVPIVDAMHAAASCFKDEPPALYSASQVESRALKKIHQPQSFVTNLFRTLVLLFDEVGGLHQHFEGLPCMLKLLVHALPQVRMTMIKTMTNAWATSHRAHEHVRHACIFGCALAPVALGHYISCELMWRPV
jgi:hypothetical protein